MLGSFNDQISNAKADVESKVAEAINKIEMKIGDALTNVHGRMQEMDSAIMNLHRAGEEMMKQMEQQNQLSELESPSKLPDDDAQHENSDP